MNYNILGYGIYFFILLVVILYVGNALFRNGRPFCINSMNGDTRMADAINRIRISGYYLINLGYTVFILMIREELPDVKRLIEVLGFKLGVIVLSIGLMHVMNVLVLLAIGRIKKKTIHTNTNP